LTSDTSTLTDGTWLDTITFTDTTHGLTVVRPIRVLKAPNYVISSTSVDWIDPTSHATRSLTDDSSVSQTLPFSFPFYGTSTTAMFIGSNGLIGFGSSTGLGTPFNQYLPDSGTPNNLAAALWMDLNPQQGGSVHYGVEGIAGSRKVVVTWNGVPPYNVLSLPMTFQIVLEEDTKNLVMRYQQVQVSNNTYGAGRPATVGVENSTGTVAAQHSHFGSSLLANGQGILYTWVGPNPSPSNAAPTIVNAASAGALNPAGTSRTVSVLGNDSDGTGEAGLIYTWSLAGSPTSIFALATNGSNTAKSSVVTFTKAGTFPIRATITDASGAFITSTVNTTVPQQLTSLGVSPVTTSVANGATVDFTALGFDQFGDAILSEPTVTWSILSGGPGSINSAGLYTASGQGSVTIQAQNGSRTATATITVTNGAPTVATPAAASPSPVTATTTTLSVLGADDGGAGNLTYTWSTFGTPPAAVTFSANNSSNAAKSSVATFSKAGDYVLRATISDASAAFVTSDINVTVQQTSTAPAMAINPLRIIGRTPSEPGRHGARCLCYERQPLSQPPEA